MSAKNWIDLILQSSTPNRPNIGIERAYLDNDGNFKTVNSSGVISDLSSAILPIDLASEVTGTLPIANGGTGQTTQTGAFDALAPTTTQGDIIYHNGTDNVRLAAGTDGQVLTLASGVPSWASGGGGMTDFDIAADTGTAETVSDGETVTIAGGTNIATAVSATNTVTVNIDGQIAVANGGTGASTESGARTNLGLAIGTDVQAYDADLAALAALASNGMIARTGAGTVAARTLTGTSGRITATNGDGVSGDPTLDLATTAVTPASYTNTNLTVDAYGRITAASNGSSGGIVVKSYTADLGTNQTTTSTSFGNVSNSNVSHTFTKSNAIVFSHTLVVNSGVANTLVRITVDGNAGADAIEAGNLANTNGDSPSWGERFTGISTGSPVTIQLQMKVSAGTGTMVARARITYTIIEYD